MGFYTEARNKEGLMIASKSHAVWNPNVEHLYVSLGLPNPYGEFSGDKGEISFTLEQLEHAYEHVKKAKFYTERKTEQLHPLVAMLTSIGGEQKIDAEEEKQRTLRFLSACIVTARDEGSITLYMG